MLKQDLVMLLESVLDIAKHGYEFSQKSDDYIREKYNLKKSESTYAFRAGWLEMDLRDIVVLIESSGIKISEVKK